MKMIVYPVYMHKWRRFKGSHGKEAGLGFTIMAACMQLSMDNEAPHHMRVATFQLAKTARLIIKHWATMYKLW